jgi:putative FmdB family regulatory protein
MPTYEYECSKCHHRFERVHSIKAPPLKTCPECRGRVRRVISGGAGVIFKGSGFYQTDYRSEGYKKAAKADQTPPAAASSSKETPAAKPAAPSPSTPAPAAPAAAKTG